MKFIKVILISIFVIIFLTQNVLALGEIFSQGENWTDTGVQHTGQTMDTTNIKDTSDALYNLLLAVATVVAIVVGAILGVKYMTAGIDEKVKVKESLFPYFISCIVVFGSLGIWKLVVSIMSNI